MLLACYVSKFLPTLFPVPPASSHNVYILPSKIWYICLFGLLPNCKPFNWLQQNPFTVIQPALPACLHLGPLPCCLCISHWLNVISSCLSSAVKNISGKCILYNSKYLQYRLFGVSPNPISVIVTNSQSTNICLLKSLWQKSHYILYFITRDNLVCQNQMQLVSVVVWHDWLLYTLQVR